MQNRNKANLILAVVFLIFIAAAAMKLIYPDSYMLELVAFTAEAALIGGIADWFAVTALFRKPLGVSWHTEIVPRNREMIIEKVSEIVGSELLNVESIKAGLAGLNLTDSILNWLASNADELAVEKQLQSFLSEKSEDIDHELVTREINKFINDYLKKENVAEEIMGLLQTSFEEGRHRDWLKSLLKKAVEVAARKSTHERIHDILLAQERHNRESSGAGSFFVKMLLNVSKSSKYNNLESLSSLIQQQLIKTLKELMEEGNPVFGKVADNAAELLKDSDNRDMLVQAVQVWKNGILNRIELYEPLSQLVSSAIESDVYRNEAAIWISGHLDNYRLLLKEDSEMKEWTDSILGGMLEKIITREHYLVGEIARETLEAFTNERLVKFIEDKAGNDLQWIRINGSIVGASAGLIVFLFTTLVYGPYVVPLIRSIFG
ncbi:MAG: DUF445 domain-containing protein [Clostridiales bacterium]|nr:DUF445 domain-containing protein [Clostridiales bacterium]